MLRVQDVCIVQYMVIQPYSTSTVHYRCCTGWADVMVSIMVEELAAIQTGEDEQQLRCVVREGVDRLTGKVTIYQMIEPARQVELRDGCPVELLAYKRGHLDRLHAKINHRIEELRMRAVPPENYPVPGSVALLEDLRSRGIRPYLASGTDEKYLRREANLLGVTQYYDGDVYGAQDDYNSFSKCILIHRILRARSVKGRRYWASAMAMWKSKT